MKDNAPTGPMCTRCGSALIACRDGMVCGCSGLTRPGPGTVALRGMTTVAELRRVGKAGVFMMREG